MTRLASASSFGGFPEPTQYLMKSRLLLRIWYNFQNEAYR